MITRGSQIRETLAESGYELVRHLPHGEVLLRDILDGSTEIWALRDDFAGYVIEIDGKGYEFVTSRTEGM